MDKNLKNSCDTITGDLVLRNLVTGQIIIIDKDMPDKTIASLYPPGTYYPLAVVAVPGTHNCYGDGSCGAVSLMNMSVETPEAGINQGADSAAMQSYEGEEFFFPTVLNPGLRKYDGQIGYFIASDYYTGVISDDGVAHYYPNYFMAYQSWIPSPYTSTQGPYKATYGPGTDFDGIYNSNALLSVIAGYGNWKKDWLYDSWSRQYNESLFWAFFPAIVCWRYCPGGTYQGQWYCPAFGEVLYLTARAKLIDSSIQKLISIYGNDKGVSIESSGYYSGMPSLFSSTCSDWSYRNGEDLGDADAPQISACFVSKSAEQASNSNSYYSITRAFLKI